MRSKTAGGRSLAEAARPQPSTATLCLPDLFWAVVRRSNGYEKSRGDRFRDSGEKEEVFQLVTATGM